MIGIIFLRKKDEVTGSWRGLHNEKLHNFHPSPSITRMVKSRNIRSAGHVVQMGRRRMHIGFDGKGRGKQATSRTKMYVCG
jgi:hypothetical protein